MVATTELQVVTLLEINKSSTCLHEPVNLCSLDTSH